MIAKTVTIVFAATVTWTMTSSVMAQRYQRTYPPRYNPGQNVYRPGSANRLDKPIYSDGQPKPHRPNYRQPQPPQNSTYRPAVQPPTKVTLAEANKPYSKYPRMVAEFEPQRAIMLSVSDLQPHHSHVIKQIVEKSAGHAEILILYNNNYQLKQTVELLKPVSHDHVSFHQLELDTVWLRDFGPRISEDPDGTRSLDFFYYGVRPMDDSFPERWSLRSKGRLTKIPWTLQGGNLLSNGQGLGLTTRKLFEDNQVSFSARGPKNEGEQFVLNEIKQFCNLRDLVVLEPLRNESTKHVDMFAAFIAPDHVLVADVDARTDNLNSRVLDWNAKRLAAVSVDGKRLKVSRIKIPARDGEAWSTYTNAIFTDRLVLVPKMESDPTNYVANAEAIYRRLLPDHHIETVDITSMKKLQGSLHCMSLNLPAFAPLPENTISFQAAESIAKRTRPANPKQQSQTTTIPMRQQLRRIFKSSTSDYLVDAYAVGVAGDIVTLLRVADKRLIRVRVTGVCKADQYWIQRNTNKIRSNGPKVQRQVVSGVRN